jgi:hypothetical protein
MIKILVIDSTKKLNFFPSKHGISKYYSPRMILHQRNLDYGKHCQYAFGTYVQAHNEPDPSNTTAPCTLDCIYLRYSDNEQGGHDLLHLQTNRMIIRRRITPVPITPVIIKQVDRIDEMDGMPKGLKITNHTSQVLYDSAWIAGVDYDEDEIEDQDYEEEEDEDDDSNYTDDDNDQYDEMDPDEIATLAEPLALQSDDEDEAQDGVELQDDEEEEADEKPKEDDNPNPTTAKQQQPPADCSMHQARDRQARVN